MSFAVKISVANEVDPVIKQALGLLSSERRQKINKIAAISSLEAVREYSRKFDAAGKWRKKKGGGGSDFGEAVTLAWKVGKVTGKIAVLENAAPHYLQKVKGGTIKPLRKKALTIPLIPEAKGLFARSRNGGISYETIYKTTLFRPKGKSVLMERLSDGSLRAVYALRASVFQKEWPGALPDDRVFVPSFVRSIETQLAQALG